MIFGGLHDRLPKKILHLVAKKALFQVYFKSKFISTLIYFFLCLHANLPKENFAFGELTTLNFRQLLV